MDWFQEESLKKLYELNSKKNLAEKHFGINNDEDEEKAESVLYDESVDFTEVNFFEHNPRMGRVFENT
jgi:hypothetical protein